METAPNVVSIATTGPVSAPGRIDGAGERVVRVVATYQLTETGRKASLLAGGNGRAVQQVALEVPGSRLHLVSVDADGVARLKLRPTFTLDAEQRIVRTDAPPTYDQLPAVDDLLRDAARNHQLERAYRGERTAEREKRREISRAYREQIAQTFLADQTKRAIAHPPPTPNRCVVVTPRGHVHFDVAREDGEGRRVPPEAHRRLRADLRARADERRQRHLAQVAAYEAKRRAIAEWVATKGTPDQQARHTAGVLPSAEVIDAIAEEAFAPLAEFPRYVHNGVERLQAHLRRFPRFADLTIAAGDLRITVEEVKVASGPQWALMERIREALPAAILVLRAHRLGWRREATAPTVTVFSVRVRLPVGPFVVMGEYAAPGD